MKGEPASCTIALYFPRKLTRCFCSAALLLWLLIAPFPLHSRTKKAAVDYGMGLIVNMPLPEPEVAQAVEDVAENTIIRGTKEYNDEEYIKNAEALSSTPEFPAWKQGGKVFYKVRKNALDPRNFKDGGDLGTLAVRYVVKPQGESNTIVRIDAVFVEDFRRVAHPSNGSVEAAEYKDIQDKLAAVELLKKETADALAEKAEKEERAAKEKLAAANRPAPGSDSAPAIAASSQPSPPVAPPDPKPPAYELQPGETLEQHVAELRREVERLVKKPGAPLQSAPFHSATTLKSLEPGAEVLVVIETPYWYGVETRDGEHGWIRRDQLEQLP